MDSSSQRSALEGTLLGQFPTDIVIEIMSHLPTASAACLALTCRPLYSILSSRYWSKLSLASKFVSRERADLLELLERDMSDHINCYFCEQLHTVEEHPPFAKRNSLFHWRKRRPCRYVPLKTSTDVEYLPRSFQYDVFQMAMKRYRLGLDCSGLLKRLELPWSENTSGCGKKSVRVRIVNGSMLMRIDVEYHLLQDKHPSLAGSACCHRHGITSSFRYKKNAHFYHYCMSCDFRNPGDEYDYDDFQRKGVLMRCPYCPSEFIVDAVEVIGQGKVGVMTVWLELGEGRTPLDPLFLDRLTNGRKYRRDNERLWVEWDELEGDESEGDDPEADHPEEDHPDWDDPEWRARIWRDPERDQATTDPLFSDLLCSVAGSIRARFEQGSDLPPPPSPPRRRRNRRNRKMLIPELLASDNED